MIGFLVFLAVCLWFGLQFTPRNKVKWAKRWKYTKPLVTHIGKDIEVTASMVYHHFSSANKKAAERAALDLDDELRRFFGH